MAELTNVAYEATSNYFNYLSSYGYRSDKDVYKLLILQFIEEFLAGRMSLFVTQEDYKIIGDALYCLFGSNCLTPYPQYKINPKILDFAIMDYKARITEDDDLRITEDGKTRVAKQ